MKTEVKKYAYRIIWSEEDQEFVGLCAEFPGLSWLEPDPDAALKGIRSVVKECVDDMVRTGEDIPLPISTREYSGKFTDEDEDMITNGMRPVHPGEILREELEELGMSAKDIARQVKPGQEAA